MSFAVDKKSFWAERVGVTRTNTLPAIYDQMKRTGRWDAMRLTWKHGDDNKPHIFWDSDIAKTVESCCYALQDMDPEDRLYKTFQGWIDEAIDMIEKSQGPDGYINIYYTVVEPDKRWTNIAHQHELYCAGHLLEAAVAHYQLTGKTRFLDIMIRYVHYIREVFGSGPGQKQGYPGHEEIELALLRLYEVKPEKEFLDLLKYFVEFRGYKNGQFYAQEAIANGIDPKEYIPRDFAQENSRSWPDAPQYWYMQAHKPIREQDEIRGHSVRAMYFLSAVQGLGNVISDESLHKAVNMLWRNMIDKKFYIHGGIGAIASWEGFGENYELPLDCYAETCASIGILFLAKRMLENVPNGEISRIMSRALYNNVIGGASLDGKSFYYDQPLIGNGHKRSDWFEVSCCPPNFSRLMNSLGDYALTKAKNNVLSLNLYIGGNYTTNLAFVSVTSKYPNEGYVSVLVRPKSPITFALALPQSSYQVTGPQGEEKDGYLYFSGVSNPLSIELAFDVKPVIIQSEPKIESTKDKIAIERGPFVYGLEQIDSPTPLSSLKIPKDLKLEERQITIQNTEIVALKSTFNGKQYQFVPYFAIGNRSPGQKFKVWLDTE
ncbi:hypothetical protein TRICI_002911 [Trichomonascus ciferrii]|uniref:Glycoside hydrolase family 127 protein n=1 Tax=Trichomonascus ciferrii TaxID=44093 RepID=A0A642V5F1_9ASCO|nr:hypothetical protein TRICI_002911 [Trichomonascus ciferrii]